MASVAQMKDPLLVGKAIRAQLENEIPRVSTFTSRCAMWLNAPQDLPLEKDFSELGGYTITDQ